LIYRLGKSKAVNTKVHEGKAKARGAKPFNVKIDILSQQGTRASLARVGSASFITFVSYTFTFQRKLGNNPGAPGGEAAN
jgi:hypothetical protein